MYVGRILCPVDFSAYSVKAYEYAQAVAKRHRARLFVLYALRPDELLDDPSMCWAPSEVLSGYCTTLLRKAEEHLQRFVETHTCNGIRPERLVREGLPADHILSFAQEGAIDLVVMGSHGRRGIDRLMLGSVTERVLRNPPCPVLVVGKAPHDFVVPENAGSPLLLRRILCCIDFSNLSDSALKHAFSLSEEHDAELILLHILEHGLGISTEEQTALAAKRLEHLRCSCSPRSSMTMAAVRSGRVHQQVVRMAAETDADLTVMGVRGRVAFHGAVFGSTAYRVIQRGSCPVLAVHA